MSSMIQLQTDIFDALQLNIKFYILSDSEIVIHTYILTLVMQKKNKYIEGAIK